ncbi:MAG: hypothetical protein ACRD2W_09990 [Acidimicrobiales bacterium]
MADLTDAVVRREPSLSDGEVYAALAPELIRFATSLVASGDAPDVLSAAVVRSLASPAWPTAADRQAYLYPGRLQ